ncbi:MAG: hypothetical protein Kow0075_03150 [Salibacteraceae bacterium]
MEKQMPYVIYAESTPNPATMKFVANKLLVSNGAVYEFKNEEDAANAPLAQRLFTFPFVRGVFVAQNFITLTKAEEVNWDDVMLEIREYISNYLNAGHPVLNEEANLESRQHEVRHEGAKQHTADHAHANTPLEKRIVEVLDEYVRPAVEGDGGAIHFKSFDGGVLTVELRGACSGCPSSTITLKAGIQSLFERMVPEVKEVVAEEA